jgi:hypothetical protein
MAGTTGLEPATSDVTGRSAPVEFIRFGRVFNEFGRHGATGRATE